MMVNASLKISELLFLIIFIVFISTGCNSGNDDKLVRKAATEALNAMQHGDVISHEEVFTSDAFIELLDGYPDFIDFEINDVIDDSETMINTYSVYATIKYSEFKSESYIILMQKVDGIWKLAAMATAGDYKKMQNY